MLVSEKVKLEFDVSAIAVPAERLSTTPSGATMTISPVRLNHAVLFVADLERA